MLSDTFHEFRRWFWRPPRAHGEVITERRVSALELLYDLVYVAVIAQIAAQLAEHVSVQGFVEFAIVFTLIWIGWVNGSLYLELHGREDGRTRSFVFVQMGFLALLAVFAGGAATDSGTPFALTYAAFVAVLVWLWNSVVGQDAPEVARVTKQYTLALFVSGLLIVLSAFLPADLRLLAWAFFDVFWILAMLALGFRRRDYPIGIVPTHSMAERFDNFTIIVLGEVVVGVVAGLSHAGQDLATIVTGSLALIIGLGFWWLYFDIVGSRLPPNNGRYIATWILSHLPITLSIAAAGAGMVSLIEHAHDPTAPELTAWLLGGSIAAFLVAEILAAWSLEDSQRLANVYRPLTVAMIVAVVFTLGIALLRPSPWLLAALFVALLTLLWIFAANKFIRAGAWTPG